MNYKMIFKVLGYILLIIALGMVAPLIIAIINRQNDMIPFAITIMITTLIGFMLTRIKIVGNKIKIVCEGPVVAKKLFEYINNHPEIEDTISQSGYLKIYTTDLSNNFRKLGNLFLKSEIEPEVVSL